MTADLGEITRNILLHFIDSSALFDGFSSPVLNTHYGFDASFVSKIEGTDDAAELKKAIVEQLGVDAKLVKDTDVEIVQWACRVVADRACALAACAVAAVVQHTGNDSAPAGEEDTGVDVGIDGR